MRKNKYIKSYLDNFFLLSYSDLFRVSMDPRVKPEGDRKKSVSEGDGRGKVPEGDRKKSVSEGVGKECALEGVGRGKVPEGDGLNDVNSMFSGIFLQSRKIGMIMMMWILVSSLTMTNTVHAECVPLPDCEAIGYTASSCDGDSLKCPFDTSKLYCFPCDTKYKYTCSGTGQVGSGDSCNGKYIECECQSSYKYACSGTGYSGGSGVACGGKYTACTCANGYEWLSNHCVLTCDVGMIYYTDKTCSSTYNSYKTVAGIVIKKNSLIMSNPMQITWSRSNIDTSLTNITSSSTAKTDMNGKSNTSVIVSAYNGESSSYNAAIYCNTYTGEISGTSGSWYLPAAGELYSYVHNNYSIINPVASTVNWEDFGLYDLWSSSEYRSNDAWLVTLPTGNMFGGYKSLSYSASCFLNIS